MLQIINKFNFLILVISLSLTVSAQQEKSADYYAGIKKVDLSRVWQAGDDPEAVPPEPLGFIGDNYQRFYIHYSSVVKSKLNPAQYIVHGKTKVKEQICSFAGTITVTKAVLYTNLQDKRYKEGAVECLIILSEDSADKSSGSFKGKLVSRFYLDEKGRAEYNDLQLGADAYRNNQCEAVWTSYKTNERKTVNWGDYRIPAAKLLDSGDGEFAVNKAYLANGWQSYATAWSGDPETASAKAAQKKERVQWWK